MAIETSTFIPEQREKQLPVNTPVVEQARGQGRKPHVKTRRFVNAAAVGLFAAGGLAFADQQLSEEIWESDRSTIATLPYEGYQPESAWSVFPGLGEKSGKKIANEMSGMAPKDQLWGYYTYDNERGLVSKDIAGELGKFHDKYARKSLNLYGQSMGAIVGLKAAVEKSIPLGKVILNSSPFDIDDARAGTFAKNLAKTGYEGEIAGKLMQTSIQEAYNNKFKIRDFVGLGAAVQKATEIVNKSTDGVSPMLLMSQLKLLAKTDLEGNYRDFASIIDPQKTKVVYAATENPADDNVVDVTQAYKKWKKFFGHFGVEVAYLPMPEAKHADTQAASQYAGEWLK